MNEPIRIGTRASRLALWQAHYVADRLRDAGLDSEIVHFSTRGDRDLDTPLPKLGDKGLFTAELDTGLLEGRIDLAVHSLKDLPTTLPAGLALAAVPVRAEPWDVLVAGDPSLTSVTELPEKAVVATSSIRRAAQLRAWRPGIRIVDVRGNVETRLAKLDREGWHGMVLAEAGLRRLDLGHRVSARFPEQIMLPGVAQGALGVVTANGSPRHETVVAVLDDPDARKPVLAERAFLRRLDGGCQTPIGALAVLSTTTLRLRGRVAAPDGSRAVNGKVEGDATDPEALGRLLADTLLARGAESILSVLRAS